MIVKLAKLAAVPVAAAALTLTAVPAATAATGPPIYSGEQAGYAAYKAHFRFIEESFTLPDASAAADVVNSYRVSVQLWSRDFVAVLGVFDTTTRSPWHGRVAVFNPATHRLVHSDTASPGMAAGDVVTEHIYYNRTTGDLDFGLVDTTAGTSFTDSFHVGPTEVFFQARAGAEFGPTPWSTRIAYAAPASEMHLVTLRHARLTSYSGHRDGWSSWWTHAKVIMTIDGTATSPVHVRPHNLWNSGHNFGVWLDG